MISSTPHARLPFLQSSNPPSQARRPIKRVRLQVPSNDERSRKRRTRSQSSPTKRTQGPSTSEAAQDEAQQERQRTVDELEEDDTLHEVMMAIDMRNRDTIGCCYYVAREEKLYFLSDITYGGLDIIDTCKFQELKYSELISKQ